MSKPVTALQTHAKTVFFALPPRSRYCRSRRLHHRERPHMRGAKVQKDLRGLSASSLGRTKDGLLDGQWRCRSDSGAVHRRSLPEDVRPLFRCASTFFLALLRVVKAASSLVTPHIDSKSEGLLGVDVWSHPVVNANADRSSAVLTQTTTFGVTDIYFLACYYKVSVQVLRGKNLSGSKYSLIAA